MKRYFSESALLQMQEAIAEADGNEVFFVGRTDERRLVVEVELLARGNRDAVSAIMVTTSFGDVVIHNHPSGVLTPSTADLEIAGIVGNQGVGFFIIDNGAQNCYQVVAPFARQSVERLAYPEIERFYAPDGPLAASLKGYEHREEQTRMAFAVAEAFNEDKVAVIEAGTGTGKSLAYLLPAVLWSTRNRERVVISTNTINLQEQLTKKDIPFLQKRAGIEFRAVLVKGRFNYLCLRKLEGIKSDPSLFQDEAASELRALIEWSAVTSDGCRSDISFIPRDETWEEVCCEADQCNRVKCSHYQRCFFYTARRAASGADILVVNHALLMADVALRKETGYSASAVLPPFERLIFDEGHHLEEVATNYLSSQVTRQGLLKLFGKLQNPRKQNRGILPQLSSQLSRLIPESLDDIYMESAGILESRLIPRRGELVDAVSRIMDAIGMSVINHLQPAGKRNREWKLRLVPAVYATQFWHEVEGSVRELATELADYASTLHALLKSCGKLPEQVTEKLTGSMADLKGIRSRLESAAEQLLLFVARTEDDCRWFDVKKGEKGLSVRICSSPLEVAESIRSVILEQFRTVVVTSATLAVGERFDYLERRTGIALLDRARVSELLLASPFDYARQTYVGIPSDIPEPTSQGYEQALKECLLEGLAISRGRAFVLFTSYDLLKRLYDGLAEPLKRLGLTPLRQGEMNRHLLLSRFKKEPHPVLFGTDSFWEGVDVQGKALELVVITRLPFRVPTEPILEARAEHIAATGGDPFMEYTVPQAVIKFKQGFGRLIRSRDDRGAVLILDSRVLTRGYGRSFLRSLPAAPIARGSASEVLEEMKGFFATSLIPISNQRCSQGGED
jgi:ATP-dependent DNA helicase DinG